MKPKNIIPLSGQYSPRARGMEEKIQEIGNLSEKEIEQKVGKLDEYLRANREGIEYKYTNRVFSRAHIGKYSIEQLLVSFCMSGDLEQFRKCQAFINEEWFQDEEFFFLESSPYPDKKGNTKPDPTGAPKLPIRGISKKVYAALCQMEKDDISPRNIHAIKDQTDLEFSVIIELMEAASWMKGFAQFVDYTKAMEERHLSRDFAKIAEKLNDGSIRDKIELKSHADKIKFPGEFEDHDIDGMNMKILDQLERAIEYKKTGERDPNAILYGLSELDELTGGMEKQEFVVIAARPAMGKTTLLRQILAFNAIHRPSLFLSIEMGKEQIHKLYACNMGGVSSFRVRKAALSQQEHGKFIHGLSQAKKLYIPSDVYEYNKGLRIIDEAPLTLTNLKQKVSRFCDACKVPPIIGLDYLQLVKNDKKGVRQDLIVTEIAETLKMLARSFDASVVSLAQLSRSVESRGGDRRPILSDLRDSGGIEQAADTVLFLYRPEYYGFETDDEGNSTTGLAEIIAAKTRHGPTGTVRAQFNTQFSGEFSDWHYYNEPKAIEKPIMTEPPPDTFEIYEEEEPGF